MTRSHRLAAACGALLLVSARGFLPSALPGGARASVSRAFIWLSCWLWLMPGLVSAGNAWQMRRKQMSARGGRHS